mgnify:CR=1 FL=1
MLVSGEIRFSPVILDPYKGLINFVGGKIEPNENGEDAAYRELLEETGITRSDISLVHLMDFTYQPCVKSTFNFVYIK